MDFVYTLIKIVKIYQKHDTEIKFDWQEEDSNMCKFKSLKMFNDF